MDVDGIQRLFCFPVDLLIVDRPELCPGKLAHKEVFRDGKVLREVDVLIDRAQPEGLRVDGGPHLYLLSVDVDFPGRLGKDPHQNLDDRRFAGPVFSHQSVDLAGKHLQVDPRQSADAREFLYDPFHGNDRLLL